MPSAVQTVSDRLAAALPSSERIGILQLLDAVDSVPAVRGFLEIEIETAVGTDTDPVRSHFDLPDDLDAATYRLLHTSIRRTATVSSSDARRILDKAVRETVAYLTRPRSYLAEMFSGDGGDVLLDDIFFRTLERITDYQYFPDVLRLWAERLRVEGFERVAKQEFTEVLGKIDRGLISHYGFDQIEELLAPLAILFNGAIPKQSLVEFFHDKSMHRVADRIGAMGIAALSIADVKQILYSVHQSTSATAGVDRDQLVAELRAAGVVLPRDRESSLLTDIEGRDVSAPHTY